MQSQQEQFTIIPTQLEFILVFFLVLMVYPFVAFELDYSYFNYSVN